MLSRWSIFIIPIVILIVLRVSPLLTLEEDIKKEREWIDHPVSSPVVHSPSISKKKVEEAKSGDSIIPDQDPSSYGIVTTTKDQMPRTQSDWDQYIKETLVDSQAVNKIKRKNSSLTAEEFQARLSLINERIKEQEKLVRENPSNEAADKKLQNLYMLKSTLTVIEGQGTKIP